MLRLLIAGNTGFIRQDVEIIKSMDFIISVKYSVKRDIEVCNTRRIF